MSLNESKLEEGLAKFRLESFRPGQLDVIQAIADGYDCLCIMPTGGGKSLCYQLPSVMREGITLVVSPLIALMKDQVDSLTRIDISAGYVNSALSPADQNDRINRMIDGEFDLMYVAPERFRSQRFIEALRETKIQLLAVDEAHCISEWGHDFRHDYTRLGAFRKTLGNPQTIALTATATDDVRQDVVKQLNLESPKTFVAGFARHNLHYGVQSQSGKKDKLDALVAALRQKSGCGIIYASTRKGCEEIAEEIAPSTSRKIVVYHGGMHPEDRRRVQEQFMSGQAQIVVATNAFGMGIDKSDVRFVIHYNLPGSLEAYYQEAGRAGRDGLQSECLMLYSASDRYIQEFFIDSAHPPPETIASIYEFLRTNQADPIELTQEELKEELGLSVGTEGVGTCERLLEKAGVLERLEPHRNMAAIRICSDTANVVDLLPKQAQVQRVVARELAKLVKQRRHELVYFRPDELAANAKLKTSNVMRALRELNKTESFDYVPPFRGRAVRMIRRDLDFEQLDIDFTELEARRKANFAKLDRVVQFATTSRCRQQEILTYFGEVATTSCLHCDNCHLAGSPQLSANVQEAILMALSGIARAKGRFGKNVVSQMLCGSGSAKMKKWKLNELSTFGLLRDLKQTDVNQLIECLTGIGLAEQSEVNRFRPTVNITETGNGVMRGKIRMPLLRLPKALERKLDVERGRPTQKQPVNTNSNPEERDVRIDQAETSAKKAETVKRSQEIVAKTQLADAIISKPAYYWTWRLFADGYTLSDVMAIRNIDAKTTLDHLTYAAESGLETQQQWILNSEQITSIRDVVKEKNSRNPRVIESSMNGKIDYSLLQFYLKTEML